MLYPVIEAIIFEVDVRAHQVVAHWGGFESIHDMSRIAKSKLLMYKSPYTRAAIPHLKASTAGI